MKDQLRRETARVRAEVYAPAPRDSHLRYGVSAASLVLLGLALVGGFYAIDVWQFPFVMAGLALVAIGVGLGVRRWQARRHNRAHRTEYDKGSNE